jgi:hypothetical protein
LAVENIGFGAPSTRMGYVLDEIVQSRRNTKAAKRLLMPPVEEARHDAEAHDYRQAAILRSSKTTNYAKC